jgi:hypothetical protein
MLRSPGCYPAAAAPRIAAIVRIVRNSSRTSIDSFGSTAAQPSPLVVRIWDAKWRVPVAVNAGFRIMTEASNNFTLIKSRNETGVGVLKEASRTSSGYRGQELRRFYEKIYLYLVIHGRYNAGPDKHATYRSGSYPAPRATFDSRSTAEPVDGPQQSKHKPEHAQLASRRRSNEGLKRQETQSEETAERHR